MKLFLIRRWFLLSLAAVMVTGFLGSDQLLPVASQTALRHAVVAGVLFVMALPLEAGAMWRTVRRPIAPLLGICMNSVALPLLTWGVVALVGPSLLGRELSLGLLVTAATPCTLASAAVWTRRAGGNDSVSIMVTVITNASCFLVTPFWLLLTTGRHSELDANQMIAKLALVVVLPMTVAQLLRLAGRVGRWATRNKTPLSVLAQLGVLTMVLFGSVQTAQRFASADTRPMLMEISTLLVCVVGLHVVTLFAGMYIATALQAERADQIAVGLAGSQKTLMVGLQVCIELGLNIIPMVAYHISQLLIDTLIADGMRRRETRK